MEEDQISQEDFEETESRKTKLNRNENYLYSDTSEENYIPAPPRLLLAGKKEKAMSTKHFEKKTNVFKTSLGRQYDIENTSTATYNIQKSSSSSLGNTGSDESSVIRTCECKNYTTLFREIIAGLEKLKSDMNYLIQLNQSKEAELTVDYDIECFEDLVLFNERLTNEDYFRQTCTKLSLLGGKDVGSVTRKVLSQLITHKLSLELNWTGRNQKNAFKDNVQKLIVASVRRNVNAKSATIEVEIAIKSWLRNSGDRGGGRTMRKSKTHPDTEKQN